jgi:hypothetical protein
MNLQDLSNLDIKDLQNINVDEIKDFLVKRIDISVNILLIVLALSAIMYFVNERNTLTRRLTAEIAQKEAKVAEVENGTTVTNDYSGFISAFPTSISDDTLGTALSEFAVNRKVQIRSFSPVSKKRDTYRQNSIIQIKIASNEYQNITNFIKDIELAPYAVRVTKWEGVMQQATGSQVPQNTTMGDMIVADVTLESINLNEK